MLRASQQQMLQFSKQAAKIRRESGNQLRSHIGQINTHMRQNSLVASQLATRNARLRQDYMFTQGAAKKAILQEMLANDLRRKQMQEHNAALSRQANHIRTTSTRNLQRQLQDIQKLKDAEMSLRHARMGAIQARRDRGISRMQRGQAIGGVGVGITAGGVAGLAFFANATKHAMKYRDEAAKTFTQVDESLGASVKKLEEMGVRVARNVPVPFKQMQETLYEIFSSMEIDNLPQAEKLLTAIGKAAVAGATDMKTAGDATISILNGFKIPIKDIDRVLDVQFRTVKEGRITYEQFASSIGRAIPSAAKAGQTIEDLGGLMAFLTRNGLSSAMAATSAARAYDLLSNPKFVSRMKNLGLEVANADGTFKSFQQVMGELKARFDGLNPEQHAAAMSKFIGLAEDPKALKALEDMGIRVKNIADPKIASQIKNNTVKLSDLSLQAARLRASKTGASKEQKKAIDAQLRQIALQKAQISNASAHARANNAVNGTLRPAVEIMADLEEKLKSVSPVERAEIMAALTKGSGGTIQAMRAVNLALTDSEGLLQSITKDTNNAGGAASKAYNIMRKTPGAKIQQLKNDWETLRQELGVRAIPVMMKIVEHLSKIVKWFSNLDESTKKNIVKWGLIVGAVMAVLGVLTILSGMLLVISGAFSLLASAGIGAALIGFGKIVAIVLIIRELLDSTNPVLKTLGVLLAAMAARSILTALGNLVTSMGMFAKNTALAGGAATVAHAKLTLLAAIKFGPIIGAMWAINNAAQNAKQNARELVDSLTKDVSHSDLGSIQKAITDIDKKQGEIGRKRKKGPLAWLAGGAQILNPWDRNTIAEANVAYNTLGVSQEEFQKRFDKTAEIFERVSKATGLSLSEVEKLAAGMDIDITKTARESVLKLIDSHRESKGVGAGFAEMFKSHTSLIQAYGDEADASKIKIKDFYKAQLESTKKWSDNIKFLSDKKLDPTFFKELVEKGPAAAGLVEAIRTEVEKHGPGFINQSIIDINQVKLDTATAVNEVLQILDNANPVLKVKIEMEKVNTEAVFGGGGGLSVFGQMKAEFGAKRTRSRGWGSGMGWTGPRREHGGLVTAGKTYLVGERRAELFTPRESGRITPRVPNSSSTGGNTYNKSVTIHARTSATEHEIADEVSWKLRHQ